MNNSKVHSTILAGVCSLALAGSAFAQTDAPDNAQSLLENVKQRDLERQMAAKQTDLDRLAEDLAKGQKEAETLHANIATTGNLLKESDTQLSKLSSQRKRLEQVLELTRLRSEAEKLKADGLKMLGEAQAKALAALTKRAEATNVRASLGAAELRLLSPAPAEASAPPAGKVAAAKLRLPLLDLRKKLAAAETSSANADSIAHDAMRAAASKLELANIANGKAKRKASTVESDLPEIAEKPLDLEEKAPEKAPEKTEKTAPPK